MSGPVEIARASWGHDAAPDWVIALAKEAERTSQAKAARKIGRSGALVSQALRNRYGGDMSALEELVRARLMGALVDCPSVGTLPLDECRDWREKSRSFTPANPMRVRMFRACKRCRLNQQRGQDDG